MLYFILASYAAVLLSEFFEILSFRNLKSGKAVSFVLGDDLALFYILEKSIYSAVSLILLSVNCFSGYLMGAPILEKGRN